MLPSAHIEFTWAVLNALQRRAGLFTDADYRLMALAATLPDLVDKPLATFVLTDEDAALLFGHTALLHGGVWASAWAAGKLEQALPYLLAFSGHLLADRMWSFSQTLCWPFKGRRFHQWQHVGSPQAILQAYFDIIRHEPLLITFEALGALLLAWVILDRGLWQRPALVDFLRSGRFEP